MTETNETGKKKHHWVTGPNHWAIDGKVDRAARVAIESCDHLTPATEARMDNCLGFLPRPLLTRAEVIARNEPGFVQPEPISVVDALPVNDWMDAEPTVDELAEIEAEAVEVVSD